MSQDDGSAGSLTDDPAYKLGLAHRIIDEALPPGHKRDCLHLAAEGLAKRNGAQDALECVVRTIDYLHASRRRALPELLAKVRLDGVDGAPRQYLLSLSRIFDELAYDALRRDGA